jgi:hypothetical protein
MKKIEFGEGRIALTCGEQKINLHQLGKVIICYQVKYLLIGC